MARMYVGPNAPAGFSDTEANYQRALSRHHLTINRSADTLPSPFVTAASNMRRGAAVNRATDIARGFAERHETEARERMAQQNEARARINAVGMNLLGAYDKAVSMFDGDINTPGAFTRKAVLSQEEYNAGMRSLNDALLDAGSAYGQAMGYGALTGSRLTQTDDGKAAFQFAYGGNRTVTVPVQNMKDKLSRSSLYVAPNQPAQPTYKDFASSDGLKYVQGFVNGVKGTWTSQDDADQSFDAFKKYGGFDPAVVDAMAKGFFRYSAPQDTSSAGENGSGGARGGAAQAAAGGWTSDPSKIRAEIQAEKEAMATLGKNDTSGKAQAEARLARLNSLLDRALGVEEQPAAPSAFDVLSGGSGPAQASAPAQSAEPSQHVETPEEYAARMQATRDAAQKAQAAADAFRKEREKKLQTERSVDETPQVNKPTPEAGSRDGVEDERVIDSLAANMNMLDRLSAKKVNELLQEAMDGKNEFRNPERFSELVRDAGGGREGRFKPAIEAGAIVWNGATRRWEINREKANTFIADMSESIRRKEKNVEQERQDSQQKMRNSLTKEDIQRTLLRSRL